MTSDEINVLGNIFNTTFGRSSTNISPTIALNTKMQGDQAIITYTSIIMLVDHHSNRQLIANEVSAAQQVIDRYIASTKKKFKKHCKRTLTMKCEDTTHTVVPVVYRPNGVPSDTVFKLTAICELR